MSNQAYIVGAVRSAVGKRGGTLAEVHPADLGAAVLSALVERTGVAPDAIDDVLWGCVGQVGPQASNIGRITVLSAGLPERVPGTTIDRQCGSSQQALHFAAQAVLSGAQDLVVAGGVEVMSQVPIALADADRAREGHGPPPRWQPAGPSATATRRSRSSAGAELIAEKWGLTREAMEAFALESHARAIRSADAGEFDDEIVEVGGPDPRRGPAARHHAPRSWPGSSRCARAAG